MIIKGKYVGIVTIDFLADENMSGLLPFDKLQKSVKEELNGVIQEMLDEEFGDIANVKVEKQFADLYITND